MSKVYFKALDCACNLTKVSAAAAELLAKFVDSESIKLGEVIPLKVHFGEKGNKTYLKPDNYFGIIDYLKSNGIKSSYMETSVLYGGERFERERHIKLALNHNFTQLPIVIADGANGEDATEIEINQRHFKSASIAKDLAAAEQVLVLSHFKGHRLAGFGGALKQLSMGFASKGGKMAMHMGVKPRVKRFKCKNCRLCLKRCQVEAISIVDKKAQINHEKCIGCGACFSICPHKAISIYSLNGIWNALFRGRFFREKLMEYALASHKGKNNIYLTFAINITRGCDCEPYPMKPCVNNIGLLISLDPVAIDSAAYDLTARQGRKFKGHEQLAYAEKIGVGSCKYELITI
ncbi:MAG: DUF362 domain-containing protein [Victivallaceae bacterium]